MNFFFTKNPNLKRRKKNVLGGVGGVGRLVGGGGGGSSK